MLNGTVKEIHVYALPGKKKFLSLQKQFVTAVRKLNHPWGKKLCHTVAIKHSGKYEINLTEIERQ